MDEENDEEVPSQKKSNENGKESGTGSSKKQKGVDVVSICAKAYTENPRPRRLGKLYAFWYNGKNEPRIVIGPDFGFSLLELAIVNGIIGLVLRGAAVSQQWTVFYAGLGILLAHDFTFLCTVMVN